MNGPEAKRRAGKTAVLRGLAVLGLAALGAKQLSVYDNTPDAGDTVTISWTTTGTDHVVLQQHVNVAIVQQVGGDIEEDDYRVSRSTDGSEIYTTRRSGLHC